MSFDVVEAPDGHELLLDVFGRGVRSLRAANILPTKTITVAAYELRLDDFGCRLLFTSSSAVTLTVPAFTKVPVTSGSVQIVQMGSGQITLVATSPATIASPETLKTSKQYATAVLTCDAADTFILAGYLEAA